MKERLAETAARFRLLGTSRRLEILTFLLQRGDWVGRSDLCETLILDEQSVLGDLSALVRSGLVEEAGSGRARAYRVGRAFTIDLGAGVRLECTGVIRGRT